MMNSNAEMKDWLEGFDLLYVITDSEEAIQIMIDLRNSPGFNRHYNRALSISRPPKDFPLTEEEFLLHGEIFQLARAKTLKLKSTNANDLAAYVVDDFAVFVNAISIGLKDPWIENHFSQYNMGRFPYRALI